MSFPSFNLWLVPENLWTILAWTIAATWGMIALMFLRGFNKRSVLRVEGHDGHMDLPRLSMIVAARNEAACIDNCIRSLFRQDYPDLEVVAINDRSTDDTGSILNRLSAEFEGRLKVVHVTTLPLGWFGKPHALTAGLEKASGSVVCFTDADCVFQASGAMRAAVAEMCHRDVDFLTITARYTMTSLRESVIVPCLSEMLITWMRPELIEDPRRPEAFANGAFILVQRAPFEQIGGWGALRSKICEDLELARMAKRSGLRLAVVQAENFYETGAYPTWRDSWNGWSRILKGALTPSQLMITLVRMLVLFVTPLVATAWGLIVTIRTGNSEWFTQGAGLALLIAVGCRCLLDVAMFRLTGSPLAAILLAPLGRFFTMAAATRALLSHAGLVKTHWRGAAFLAGQMVMPQQATVDSRIPSIPATRAGARI